MHPRHLLSGLAALLASAVASAADPPVPDLEEVVVLARRLERVGSVESASEGTVLGEQLQNRPALRTGEILEVAPRLVVTQHRGDGKANQYFLRGFNLDHGTDFATRIDGVPVNLPTNAHGQAYSDLNFLLPELVDHVDYKKGTYYAEEGDCSAAGSADVSYRRRVDAPTLTLSVGQERFGRALLAASPRVAGGDLLVGGEYAHNDGPWDLNEAYGEFAALVKFTTGGAERGWGVEAMGYGGHWHSSDQVPLRAVSAGLIGRFGTIDPTDGGRTHRYSLSADGWPKAGAGRLHANAYAVEYALDPVSNFTCALDPVHGDQFEQLERRHLYGGSVDYDQALLL